MGKKTINIKKICKYILLIILFLPFIQQRTIEELPNFLKLFYNYGIILSSIIMYLYLLINKKIKMNQFLVIFIILAAFYCCNSFFKWPESVLFCLKHFFCMIALIIFITKSLENNSYDVIHSLALIYHFFIIANFILLILFPQGIYKTSVISYHNGHLLGDDNALIYVLLPGIIITCVDSIIKKKKISFLNIIEILMCEISFIKVWSATSVVCFSLFILLLIVDKIKKIPVSILISIFIVALLILLFGLSSPIIQNIILNVLHKSVTLSGRTLVWRDSFILIKNRLLSGYGGYFSYGKFYYNGMYYPCHTPYLQILLDSGIVGMILYVCLFISVFLKIRKNYNNRAIRIVTIGIICIMINYILEYSQFFHLYILLCLAYNFDNVLKQNNHIKEVA